MQSWFVSSFGSQPSGHLACKGPSDYSLSPFIVSLHFIQSELPPNEFASCLSMHTHQKVIPRTALVFTVVWLALKNELR